MMALILHMPSCEKNSGQQKGEERHHQGGRARRMRMPTTQGGGLHHHHHHHRGHHCCCAAPVATARRRAPILAPHGANRGRACRCASGCGMLTSKSERPCKASGERLDRRAGAGRREQLSDNGWLERGRLALERAACGSRELAQTTNTATNHRAQRRPRAR